jgi:GT2 family glycosyltransferase
VIAPSDATVVVVSWNGAHLLPACLDSALPQGAHVIVVDNASVDDTLQLLNDRYPQVQVVRSVSNSGFAGGVAQALAVVETPVTVLLNNDATVRDGWLRALLDELDSPEVAAVSSKLLLPDGMLNSAGGYVTYDGYGHDIGFREADHGRYETPADVMYACGAAAAFRTAAMRSVGGVDPRFFLYYEDVDLSWRLRLAGYSVRYAPAAVAVHQHSASTGAGSLLHTYYTERNRLATLVRCATAGLAWRALLRYPLTTVSVALFESRAKARVRVRAYVHFLRWLPKLLSDRRSVRVRVPRAQVQQRFLARHPPTGQISQ